MIAHHGEAKAEEWLTGVKANLARKPKGGDRDQVKAVAEGECDIALGNSYYYGAMLKIPEQKPWAEAVNLVFPTIAGTKGTHVNVRSEEHTSELQSLMRISYAVFCLKKKTTENTKKSNNNNNKR